MAAWRAHRTWAADGAEAAAKGVAHSPQNLTLGGLDAPQTGQTADNRAAHSPQNLRPASLVAPQLEQITLSPATSSRWGS